RNDDTAVAGAKIVNYIVLSNIRHPEHILHGIVASGDIGNGGAKRRSGRVWGVCRGRSRRRRRGSAANCGRPGWVGRRWAGRSRTEQLRQVGLRKCILVLICAPKDKKSRNAYDTNERSTVAPDNLAHIHGSGAEINSDAQRKSSATDCTGQDTS